jgi:hypothetical protein
MGDTGMMLGEIDTLGLDAQDSSSSPSAAISPPRYHHKNQYVLA